MDWLDEKVEMIGKMIHNLSLWKSMIAYIIICIVSVCALYAFTISICDRYENQIWSKYESNNDQVNQKLVVYYHDYSKLNKTEVIVVNIFEGIKALSVFIYPIGGILIVSLLYYKKKIKQPLHILKDASLQVGSSNLDFEIYYDSKDEMGDLCRSFDFMRKQLIQNNQKMWDTMEEQKRLNAAFAHDLRTPLTVLRGYADFLTKYIPQGKISEEKLLSTLSMMSNQIERLDRYSNTMKQIHSFEELPVQQSKMTWQQVLDRLNECILVLNGKNGISVMLSDDMEQCCDLMYLDEALFMEVFENLVSNALRYAKTRVEIVLLISEEGNQLMLSVADDGKGFSGKDLSMAAKPYYTDGEDKSSHFGIGLYICSMLCEKHGGWLSLSNSMKHGANVTAAFYIKDLYKKNGIAEY